MFAIVLIMIVTMRPRNYRPRTFSVIISPLYATSHGRCVPDPDDYNYFYMFKYILG